MIVGEVHVGWYVAFEELIEFAIDSDYTNTSIQSEIVY